MRWARRLCGWGLAIALLPVTVARVQAQQPAPVALPRAPAVPEEVPCGEVFFKPFDRPHYSSGTASESIAATVQFADGHTETARFPYLWVYQDGERTDPWSSTNLKQPDLPAALQLPPPDFDRSSLPPLLAFVLAHTDKNGLTDLPSCPVKKRIPTPEDPNYHVVSDIAAAARIDALISFRGHGVPATNHTTRVKECITFINRAPRAARRVQFAFRYLDAAGNDLGTESLDVSGRFEPDVVIAPVQSVSDDIERLYCRPFAEPPAVLAANRNAIARIRLAVTAVEYDDGSRWPTDPSPKSLRLP